MKFNVTVTAIDGANKQVTRNGNVKFELDFCYKMVVDGLIETTFEDTFDVFDFCPGQEMHYIVSYCEGWFDGKGGRPKMTGINIGRVATE